ncbi:arrestin domain-containing protein 3-like [Physella acuta]|uniref:arrestin domain-containing protein 3-like n=1 Tax=Physella acuta TaxID=109671 RepID=UPI0027DD1D1F|nr:arrestin domain-containing protein 3-like [Physella acuta]
MGKATVFEISYDQPDGVYNSGSKVSGYVRLAFDVPTRVRAISIRFKGKAKAKWTQPVGELNRNTNVVVREPYFDQTFMLMGVAPPLVQIDQELPRGLHNFRFNYQLPLGLPSSFKVYDGKVEYLAVCYLMWPGSLNKKLKVPFTIIGFLDLNRIMSMGQEGAEEQTVCCCCCKTGPIKARFHIEKNTFVPGEAIKLFAEINNGSGRITETCVSLNMLYTFKLNEMEHRSVREIAKVTRPGIAPYETDVWSGEELVIPPTPPSFLPGCNLIDIEYFLELNISSANLGSYPPIRLKIIIGTVRTVTTTQPVALQVARLVMQMATNRLWPFN